MSSIIQVHHLSKHYQVFEKKPGLLASLKSVVYRPEKTVKAVEDVSFSINAGEFVGFIGPNGAGKTTTLKCLSGLLYPTSGEISVLGFNPSKRQSEYLRQIGFVMGQKNQLWWDIPPQETFLLNKAIYDISDHDYRQRLDFFVSTLDIENVISVQTKKLSLGQRMKCEFVAALLHNPKVVFLDEPTIGLDVVANQKIRSFIKEYNREFKSTVILTSHNMADVSELCQRVIVIDKGSLKFDGDLDDLTSQYRQDKTLKFTFSKRVSASKFENFGRIISSQPNKVVLMVDKNRALKIAGEILRSYSVTDLTVEDTPIEDIIRQIFSGK